MSKSEQQSIEQRRRYGVRVKVCPKVLDVERRFIDASKVVVAPKVGFLPQKSFRSVIPFADHDLPAAISEFVFVWPPGFTLVGLLVGLA